MEVALIDAHGVPKHAILSVRAGTTRRQAPAEVGKLKLGFPKGFPLGEPLKVDLLASIGSATLDLNSLNDAGHYDVIFPQSSSKVILSAAVAGQQAPLENIGGSAGIIQPIENDAKGNQFSPSKRHLATLAARKYLEKHKLLAWSQLLFHDLIRDEPEDPWDYVEKHVAAGRNANCTKERVESIQSLRNRADKMANDVAQLGREISYKASDLGGDRASKCQKSVAAIGETMTDSFKELAGQLDILEGKTPAFVEELRAHLGAQFENACKDGSLQAALPASIDPKDEMQHAKPGMEELRNEAALAASIDPKDEMQHAKPDLEQLRNKARDVLQQAANNGSLKEVIQSTEGPNAEAVDRDQESADMLELRKQAHRLLSEACMSGRLAEALQSTKAGMMDGESLRMMTCDTLTKASMDGRLDEALNSRKKTAKLEELQKLAGQTLSQAVVDGRLDEAFASARAEMEKKDAQELCGKAYNLLSQGINSGRLAEALAQDTQQTDPGLDEDRTATGRILMEASMDGRLAKALESTDQSNAEQLRMQAGDMLARASMDGRLMRALSDLHAEDNDTEALRSKAGDVLTETSHDGHLGEAFTSAGADELHAEELRRMAVETITQASLDGRLLETLRTVDDLEALAQTEKQHDQSLDFRTNVREALAQGSHDRRLVQALTSTARGGMDAEAARRQIGGTLAEAAANGQLEKVLAETMNHDEQSLDFQKNAREALTQGCQDGRFVQTLASTAGRDTETAHKLIGAILVGMANDGRLGKALPLDIAGRSDQEDPPLGAEDLRKAVRQELSAACEDGRLSEAVAARNSGLIEELEVRKMAAKVLSEALSSGRLEQAFRANQMEAIRKEASRTLLQARADGRLEAALSSAKSGELVEEYRKNLQEAFVQASMDGRLEKALDATPTKLRPKHLDDLRALAREKLIQASLDGQLSEAIGNSSSGQLSPAAVREVASETLLAASMDGRLSAVLQQVNVEEMHQIACETLQQASTDGRLEEALRKIKAERPGIDQLRQKAREILAQAAKDGRLTAVWQNYGHKQGSETVAPEAPPEAASEAPPEAASEAPPEAAPEAPSEAAPEAAPEAPSEAPTETAPETAPEAMRDVAVEEGEARQALDDVVVQDTRETIQSLSQDLHALRAMATQEITNARAQTLQAKQDITETYGEVRQEIHELRSQAREAQQEFEVLREMAQQIKALLQLRGAPGQS